jgi:hypothetical protein
LRKTDRLSFAKELSQRKPVAVDSFGGVMDYNQIYFCICKTRGWIKPHLEKDGFKEVEPGLCDLRDWNEIRS